MNIINFGSAEKLDKSALLKISTDIVIQTVVQQSSSPEALQAIFHAKTNEQGLCQIKKKQQNTDQIGVLFSCQSHPRKSFVFNYLII